MPFLANYLPTFSTTGTVETLLASDGSRISRLILSIFAASSSGRNYTSTTCKKTIDLPSLPVELTRMLALLNVSMSDSGVASWDTKYFYNIARPITAIRKGDLDANPKTIGDTNWTPLGAPATNLNGPNFSPPFPAYTSGHATFGGALFQTLRNVFGTDNISFTFVSDELNGVTPGNDGVPRPLRPRTFRTLSEAEEENGQSRIYLGIHWKMDKVEGIKMGRTVANYIHLNRFRKKK